MSRQINFVSVKKIFLFYLQIININFPQFNNIQILSMLKVNFFPQNHFVEIVEILCYPRTHREKSVDNVVDTSVVT